MKWGYCGVLWAMLIGQSLGLVVYILNYSFNPGFSKIPSIMKNKKIAKALSDDRNVAENLNQSLVEKQEQEE